MTATEVAQALQSFQERLSDLGVPVVDRLRPGLTRAEADSIAAEFGVRLSEDAAAWWMWHDGDRERSEDDRGTPSLTPFSVFCGLRSALEQSARAHSNSWLPDAELDPARPDADWRFHPQWVTLLQSGTPLIIDCREPDLADSPTGVWAPIGGLGSTIALTERIGWWHWALDNGYWIVRPDGSWDRDLARSPGALVGLHARDHAE